MHNKSRKKLIYMTVILFMFTVYTFPAQFNQIYQEALNRDNYNGGNVESSEKFIQEIASFIPEGGEHFSSAYGWSYPTDQSYRDSFWGENPIDYTDQDWNPANEYLIDQNSEVSGSTDFGNWNEGAGAIRLDAARREYDYRTTDGNVTYSLKEFAPDTTGSLSGGAEFRSQYYSVNDIEDPWILDYTSDYYPANRDDVGTYYTTNDENWAYGNTQNAPIRTITDNLGSSEQFSMELQRQTWYEVQYNNRDSNRIDIEWDNTVDYSSEFRMYFYYENTSQSTEAYYSAMVDLTAIGNLSPVSGGSISLGLYDYDTDITGTITYEIWNDDTDTAVSGTGIQKTLDDSDAFGDFRGSSGTVSESMNFGGLLETGQFYLSIVTNISLNMAGTFTEEDEGATVTDVRYEDDGITLEITQPRLSIKETTPIDPKQNWGSLGYLEPSAAVQGWYNDDWENRKLITLDSSQVPGDLTDFPVLVQFDAESDLAANTQSLGQDLVFVDKTTGTKLAHEIQSYNGATGELIAWVKIPSLSSSIDTEIYLYYGNPNCAAQSDPENVWDDDYEAVLHLQESGDGTTDEFKDSTSNDHDATGGDRDAFDGIGSATATPARTTGKIGYAQDYTPTDLDIIRLDNVYDSDWTGFTSQVWVYYDTSARWTRLLGTAWDSASDTNTYLLHSTGSSEIGVRMRTDDASNTGFNHAGLSNGEWFLAHATWDAASYTIRVYLNGQQLGQTLISGATLWDSPPTNAPSIGNAPAADRTLDGMLQEARISTVARSADWIGTEYANQNNPSGFVSVGNEEIRPVGQVNYKYLGGIAPDTENMYITGINVHVDNRAQIAVGVWTGGTLTDPTGATLRTQAKSVEVFEGWNYVPLTNVDWNSDSVTWIGFTTNGSGKISPLNNPNLSDFWQVAGAWNQTSPSAAGVSNDMDSNIGSGAFIPEFYALNLEFDTNSHYYAERSIESDWIDWGFGRTIPASESPKLRFGYQIPDDFRGWGGNSESLEHAYVFANLTVEKSGQEFYYTQIDDKSFAEVRSLDDGLGAGCDEYEWLLPTQAITSLNDSTRIKWTVGIMFDYGLELGNNFTFNSRVYFNNINFTLQTQSRIAGTFSVRDPKGSTITGFNVTIYDQNDLAEIFHGTTTSSEVTIDSLYNGNWQMIVNKTIGDRTVVIYNSTYTVDSSTLTFSDLVISNLTNIIYHVEDYSGADYTGSTVTLQSVSNPSYILSETLNSTGHGYFQEIYNDDWQLTVSTGAGYTVYNDTRTININSPTITGTQHYLITDESLTEIQIDLTNIELHVRDPTDLNPVAGFTVQFDSVSDPGDTRELTTDASGNAILRELSTGDWNLYIKSSGGYLVYEELGIDIAATQELFSKTVTYNLTNIEIEVLNYAGDPISDTFSPVVRLTNLDDSYMVQKFASSGFANLDRLYNGTSDQSWNLVIEVNPSGTAHIVYNSSFTISTNLAFVQTSVQVNLTTFELSVKDNEGLLLENAQIQMINNADNSITRTGITNADGKVTFSQMFSDSWQLYIDFTVGEGIGNNRTYRIFENLGYSQINPTGNVFVTSDIITGCNLTTLEMYAMNDDPAVDRIYAGLNNAEIILRNATNPTDNITTFTTDSSGYVAVQIPLTAFNFSINYQGIAREFNFNDTGDYIDDYSKSKLITGFDSTELNVSINAAATKLSIDSYSFGNQGFYGWDSNNGQTIDTGKDPNEIFLYQEDSIELSLLFEDLKNNLDLSNTTLAGSWELSNSSGIVDTSSVANLYTGVLGIFNFTFDSLNYSPGEYNLQFLFENGGGYLDAYLNLKVIVMSFTSSLSRISPLGTIEAGWHEDLSIWVNYTSVLPEVRDLSDATVLYSIAGTLYQDVVALNPSGYSGTGVFEVIIPQWSLEVGVYSLYVEASEEGNTLRTLTIPFEITEVPTDSVSHIEDFYSVSQSYLKAAYGENFTVHMNFSYLANTSIWDSAQYSAYLDNPGNPLNVVPSTLGSWNMMVTDYTTLYATGLHTIYITAYGPNHDSQTIQIDLEILNFWDTTLEITQNPYITPWGNNATFTVEYTASDNPRDQELLSADITELKITYIDGGEEYVLHTLTASDSQVWGWSEIGSGTYSVWVNTSIIEITQTSDFYLIPTIEIGVYRPATVRPILWVEPLEMEAALSSLGGSINTLTLNFGDSQQIDVRLEISEISSLLLGDFVESALGTYRVYNSTSDLIKVGFLADIGGGDYNFDLQASNVGDFLVEVSFILDNHTLSNTASLTLTVIIEPAQFTVNIDDTLRVSATSLKVSYGELIVFNISYFETMAQYPTLTVELDGIELDITDLTNGVFQVSHSADIFTTGNDIITITSTQQYANPVIQEIEVEIMNFWDTQLTIIEPPKVYPWGNLSSFIMQYESIDVPRDGILLDGATISQLEIRDESDQTLRVLSDDDLEIGILWDWTDLGNGQYEIWFNTSIVEVIELSFFYAVPTIDAGVYRTATIKPITWVRPTEVEIALTSNEQAVPSSLELGISEDYPIIASLTVIDTESINYGEKLSGALINFAIVNASDHGQIFRSGALTDLGNGNYTFIVNVSVSGNFDVVFTFVLANRLLVNTPSVSFYTEKVATEYATLIPTVYRIGSSSIRVAHGENITFSITYTDDSTAPIEPTVEIDGTPLTIYDLGNRTYFVDHPADAFTVGNYKMFIEVEQQLHKPVNTTFDVDILDFWNTRTDILIPPVIYPWNEISSFIIKYTCAEEPRGGELMDSATISRLEISREIDDVMTLVMTLGAESQGNYWNWTNIGEGKYEVWFNTTLIDLTEDAVIYTRPYIQQSIYRENYIDPYIWITPVETTLELFNTQTSAFTIDSVEYKLDETFDVYARLMVSDLQSVLLNNLLSDATLHYNLYQRNVDESLQFVRNGTLNPIGGGYYYGQFDAYDLGDFVFEFYNELLNYSASVATLNVEIQEKPITITFDSAIVINNAISTPENREISFTVDLYDSVNDIPLSGAILRVNFEGTIYEFEEVTPNSGTYRITFNEEDLNAAGVGSYQLSVDFIKTNYTANTQTLTFEVSLPVDRYVGLPYLYWGIIGATAFLIVGIFVTTRIVKYARIPQFVKLIAQTKKAIQKKKEFPPDAVVITAEEEFIQHHSNLWRMIGMDIKNTLAENKPAEKKRDNMFMAMGDTYNPEEGI